jgi:hypothetical protein
MGTIYGSSEAGSGASRDSGAASRGASVASGEASSSGIRWAMVMRVAQTGYDKEGF